MSFKQREEEGGGERRITERSSCSTVVEDEEVCAFLHACLPSRLNSGEGSSLAILHLSDSLPLPLFLIAQDNYGYLLIYEATQEAAIDAEADTVMAAAAKAGVTITHVLTTHKHWDHAGGNAEMHKWLPNMPVLGGAVDDVTACTQALQEYE